MEMIDFLVARDDFARTRWMQAPLPELAEGEVLATIERFAFTANNMTYAGFGADMRYWDFFPAGPGFGKIPVWGTGRIVRSRHPDLPEGEAIYGYVPMSSHLVLQPESVRSRAFLDGAPHRAGLPATYNEYARLAQDADYAPAQADLHLVLRPLFALAFFIGAWLRENAFFGASTVIVSSASSKTGLAIGSVLQDAGVATLGLTSPGNRKAIAWPTTARSKRLIARHWSMSTSPTIPISGGAYMGISTSSCVIRAARVLHTGWPVSRSRYRDPRQYFSSRRRIFWRCAGPGGRTCCASV